jgi:hypothetical protein
MLHCFVAMIRHIRIAIHGMCMMLQGMPLNTKVICLLFAIHHAGHGVDYHIWQTQSLVKKS